jgi:hypothetical protein
MSMTTIITARITDEAGRPVPRLKVDAQLFHRGRAWRTLAGDATTAEGALRLQAVIEGESEFVPALRLVRTGAGPTAVIAQSPRLRLLRAQLQVDFGEVTLLAEGVEDTPGVGGGDRIVGVSRALAELLRGGSPAPGGQPPGAPPPRELPEADVRAVAALREMLAVASAKSDEMEARLGAREARVGELARELDAARSERDAIAGEVETLRRSEKSSPTVSGLAGALSGALDEARSLGGMELVKAEIRLRGIVSEAGARFHPLDAAEARHLQPENLSELLLRFDPPQPKEAGEGRVPDLLGRTVGPARRLALAVGLELEVVEEITADRPAGAIIAQAPQAGTPVSTAAGRLTAVVAVPPQQREDPS